MDDQEFEKAESQYERDKARNENLKRLADEHGGEVAYDSQYGRGVHVHAFKFIAEDGTVIYEFP